jgi:hypothetical protein
MQAAILALLTVSGVLYLVFTIEPRDLLLNAVALQIVVELDELFFTAFAPNHASKVLLSLNPLPRPPVKSFKGLNVGPAIGMVIIIVAQLMIYLSLLKPQKDVLRDIVQEICGGNLNFVARADPSGMIYAGAYSASYVIQEDSYEYQAMRQLVLDVPGENIEAFAGTLVKGEVSKSAAANGMTGSYWSLEAIGRLDVQHSSAWWNSNCLDMLTDSPGEEIGTLPFFRRILHDAIEEDVFTANEDEHVSHPPLTDCHSVLSHCSRDSAAGVRSRQICPETCGCLKPASEVVQGVKQNGCPPQCEWTSQYKNKSRTRTCDDLPVESPEFQVQLEGIRSVRDSYPNSWKSSIEEIISLLENSGCNATLTKFTIHGWEDLCQRSFGWYFEPLSYLCPISCGCHVTEKLHCPAQCVEKRLALTSVAVSAVR